MSVPSATYRVQLRQGMTFARAASLAPYLKSLGISHVYLSPIFRAVPGSAHGYDTTDFNEIEPELGGREGFAAMADAFRDNGLKTIVDFVPNHMGANPANPWWRDVLEWGAASSYAQHFDVDWSAPKLLIPALGKSYGETLRAGEIRLSFDAARGAFLARHYDLELPLTPPSYATVLALAGGDPFAEIARRFAASSPDTAEDAQRDLAASAADQSTVDRIEACLAKLRAQPAAMHVLLEAQTWRLAHWRASRESLTYRRFFEISDLVGVRVENLRVFDDVHGTILPLLKEKRVDGLRIDHVDGLADPLAYLARLRDLAGPDTYIVVEKILGGHEELRSEWPVAGTTGYEFIRDLAPALLARCEPEMTIGYARFTGREFDFNGEKIATKRRTLFRNLAGELDVLTSQALDLARGDADTRDFGADTLRRAIVELASHLDVYRTYIDTAGAKPADHTVLRAAASIAKTSREVEDETAIDLIVKYLSLDLDTPERQVAALSFTTRFQQTTGPVMAKAVEDTLFYRFNRLIAVNEVGGEPNHLGGDLADFHDRMEARQINAPVALTATATHDTKRGEDGRARIYAISEMPVEWVSAVERWSGLLAQHRVETSGAHVPEPDTEWLFYQSLLGAWPAGLDARNAAALSKLQGRMAAFMQKAAREAKLRTSWTQPDTAYEQSLDQFVQRALDPEVSQSFLLDFAETIRVLLLAGVINSLTQLVIKLFVPGVPDIYQGTELWDDSLVDPDNRALVDYDVRRLQAPAETPAALLTRWQDGSVKLHCLHQGLALRFRFGEALTRAEYIALRVEGPLALHVIAFARSWDNNAIVIVATRLAVSLVQDETLPHVAASQWRDTVVVLPEDLRGAAFENVMTNATLSPKAERMDVAMLLRDLPVAVLIAAKSKPK